MPSEQRVKNKLKTVIDPELGINIVDLGLIYKVKVENKGKVEILMTLTTPGCPLAGVFNDLVGNAVRELAGVEDVFIELTFDPPWTEEMMTKEARAELGFD
jgi:FeS assembly SUF system protein